MRLAGMLFVAALLPSAAFAGSLSLRTTDGQTIAAESTGTGSHGVVLIHEDAGDKSGWTDLAATLAKNDFTVVAIDLRGHGASKGTLDDASYPKMVADVQSAITWLNGRGVKDVALVGAELGANLALATAAANPDVDTLALLSPSLSAKGVRVSTALDSLGQRPVLLVASRDDAGAARAAALIYDKATGAKHLAVYDGNAAGRRMLNTAPALEGLLLSWLNGSFLQADDPRAASGAAVQTDVEAIETTGERFEDKH
jgi:pimeloyl-ACP methyl ester carboxylesterase